MSDLTLLDTNVLVYATAPSEPQHEAARTLCANALAGRMSACIAAQVMIEFFSVVTSSKRVKHPREPSAAWAEIEKYRARVRVLSAPADIVERVRAIAEPLFLGVDRLTSPES